MSGLPDDDLPPSAQLSRKIIGLAMQAHRTLGCGFGESIYREAMVSELRSEGIAFEVHPNLPVHYKGVRIGVFQADLVVEGGLIVELKPSNSSRSHIPSNSSPTSPPRVSSTAFCSTSAARASISDPNNQN